MLPADASCEDLEVDASLGFLSSFVQAALQAGAAPYISEADRFDMGAVRPSHQDAAVDHSQGLRFTAYERQGAPEAVTVRTVSRDPSPLRGARPTPPQRRSYPSHALPALAWLPCCHCSLSALAELPFLTNGSLAMRAFSEETTCKPCHPRLGSLLSVQELHVQSLCLQRRGRPDCWETEWAGPPEAPLRSLSWRCGRLAGRSGGQPASRQLPPHLLQPRYQPPALQAGPLGSRGPPEFIWKHSNDARNYEQHTSKLMPPK